ncbi:MAG TPA: hypothetical protein VF319_06450 [Caldimonas sp.]
MVAPKLHAYFNRGLISTQHVSQALDGAPSSSKLLDLIRQPGNALRNSLAGDMTGALLGFVQRARSGGKLYAALYELGDEELVSALEAAGKKLHLVLSNPSASDKQSASAVTDGNALSQARLAKTASVLLSRMLPANQIGHNKFVVHVNRTGHASAVLFGSTNWTSTGLCAQTNNTIVCEEPALAKRYLDYSHQLAADTTSAGADPKALQAASLRAWDAKSKLIALAPRQHADELVLAQHAEAARQQHENRKAPARHGRSRRADRRRQARGAVSRLLSGQPEPCQLGRRSAEGRQEPVRPRLRHEPLGGGRFFLRPHRAKAAQAQAG